MEEKNLTPTATPTAETSVESKQKALPVPRKVRGTLTIKSDDDMEFRAMRSTGISAQEEIKKTAAGKLYRTVGTKQKSTVCHIVVPDDEVDPRAFIFEQADRLTKNMNDSKATSPLRGKLLRKDDNLRITLSQKEHRIEVRFIIDLAATPNYLQELMNIMQKTNQCFAINSTSLANARP